MNVLKKIPFLIILITFPRISSGTQIIVSSLGYNSTDATSFLQAAINSGYDTVIVDQQANHWNTQPLFIDSISNLTIILEPGVQIVAKSGAFPGLNDNLLRISSSDHIFIIGYGATLRMLKAEYITGEWRHCLAIKNSSNIDIRGLELNDSGGDGVYLADLSSTNTYCSHIHIKDCLMNNNKRQGLSIISADDVLIEHCEMSNTSGASPEAGIDFEPDIPSQRMTNIVMRKCRVTGNNGPGIQINSKYLDGTSVPISILIEQCYLAGNHESQLYLNSDTIEAPGNVLVNQTFIENSAFPGVYVEKSASDFFLTMNDCVLKNVADTSFSFYSPITMQTFASLQNTSEYGGAAFNNCLIEFSKNRAYMQCVDLGLPPGSADISGNFTIVNPFGVLPSFGSSPNNINASQTFFTSFPTQQVSVNTSDADAFEGELDHAGFEILRNTTDSFPLAVNYAMSGSAANRTDYSLLPGFIIIPSLSNSSVDSLNAIADLTAETTEEAHLKISSSSSYQLTGQDSVVLFIDPVPAGMPDPFRNNSFALYPVPANDELFINDPNETIQRVSVFTMEGKKQNITFPTGLSYIKLHTGTLTPGLYMLKIQTRNGFEMKKFIKN